ncbi:M-phase phosphoprotein 9-like [Ruditapes philippinarum]|uniref:M-phase phosphoprotein 9-like n=1 Tax=Ruditapes philippinarum TaxID=129788 RepID=UPI00295C0C4E|nr:M-phase phosphoprotein 9-like [Ruditapes philippinarum]
MDCTRFTARQVYYINYHHNPLYCKHRYTSEASHRSEVTTDYKRPSSTSYEEELLRRAYDRVSHQQHDKPHTVPGVRSHESSAIIPGFKTLQDQQAKWSDMFHKIEDEHRLELRSQYDRHQYNIQRLQQQMELELQKQHLAIRKKLDIHKEALAKMSPDRGSSGRQRSPDRSLSPERGQRSPERGQRSPERGQRSPERGQRSPDRPKVERSGEHTDVSTMQNAFDSKSWREIYREVRQEEEQDHSPPRPLKRTLDDDFATLDSTLERSRPSGERSSPRGSSDLSRSGSRDPSREVIISGSERTQPSMRLSKAERDMSLGKNVKVSSRQRSPEGRDSRSFERDSRSSFGRELVPPLHLPDGASPEGVSRHVQELLDNLNDSRHSLHDLEDGVTSGRPLPHHGDRSSERPRAGVYSSPMPSFTSSRSLQKPAEKLVDTSSTNMNNNRFTQSLPVGRDRAEFYTERPRTTGGRDRSGESLRTDDVCLSPSTRMNLREKHAKHLNDLRTYYEDELRELRKALSDTMDASAVSVNTSLQSSAHDPLLEAENRQLSDKCRMLEDEMEEVQKQVRTLEQKNHGLEKRASEYAAAYADSQTMSVQHRAHIEELQRYCRERDDLINELESKMVTNDDSVKIYKKNLDDEIELHRQDKIALQRMLDRYESLEREYKLLQETMSTTENKLYETRTEIVELNRIISKLELENKRLGRENDNLRHKVTQSLNLSTLHESFGSPSSPRDVQNILSSHSAASAGLNTSLSMSQSGPPDGRLPGFATSMKDWTPAQKSRPKSAETNRSRTEEFNSSKQSVVQKEKKVSKSRRKEDVESSKGRQSEKSTGAKNIRGDSSISSSREDVTNRSQSRRKEGDDRPVRDTTPPRRNVSPPRRELTPPRSASPCSQAESEVSDYSPLLKAERELFKLRDMMRQAVAVKPSSSPPPIKLQKKFYGSERPSSTDDYTPDLGVQRGRKEKPSISSHSSVAKTKSSQTPVKSDKSSSKRQSSVKSEKSTKSKDRGSGKDQDRRERGKEKMERENGRQREKTPPRREELVDTSTRFDIDFNEADKSVTVSQRKVDNQSGKQKNLTNGETRDQSKDKNSTKDNYSSQGAEGQIENTLDMMRHGQFTTRPEWENIYTSLAKPKSETQSAPRNMEEKVKDRLRSIAEMESRYDGLQVEKRQLESSINKIPLHGRVDRNNRKQKEELENKLDAVERELGSLRMTLKRYNVLKTAG